MNYFQRFEKKFFIDFTQEMKIKKKFKNIFDLEFDHGYYCYSLYFDDLNFSTLRQKQEGNTKRHKIRLRTYFSDLNDKIDSWNLEIKSKDNNTVKKRKISFSHQEVLDNLKKKNYSFFSNNFVETSKTYYEPVYITLYFREAFISKIIPHCRITFDKSIRCFKYDYDILGQLNIDQNFILDPKLILLELKYSNFLPKFISEFFTYLNLDQVTFSKYVDGYETYNSKLLNKM
ncbi:VTC domain-containing protein [Candidatus Pelagibacter sp.]|nr:VTC domain-containing protein [Candidatus Pelagibacter sp.]